MDLTTLLTQGHDCPCGRRHIAGIRHYAYAENVIDTLPDTLLQVTDVSLSRCTVVADVRTWDVCGKRVYDTLGRSGIIEYIILDDTNHGGPVCDRHTVEQLRDKIAEASAQIVIGVGSGVVNDLCKWASFELGLPYLIVATAASMNGYAAANVAPMVDGVKVLVRAAAPVAVLAQPQVIENAPFEMTAAGFGDTIAKFQSNCDWIMNHFLFDEYYCEFCASLIDGIEQKLQNPEDIRARKPDAIATLFEALFCSGLAMTLVGTSAPASGGEHLLSHTLDMASFVQGREYDLHGRQVGLGVILSSLLYEHILQRDRLQLGDLPDDIDETFWKQPHVIEAVREQYQQKQQSIKQVKDKLSDPAQWQILRNKLKKAVRTPQQIKQWLTQAGAACRPEDIGCSQDQLSEAIAHMHEIRKRFTIVDLAKLTSDLSKDMSDYF